VLISTVFVLGCSDDAVTEPDSVTEVENDAGRTDSDSEDAEVGADAEDGSVDAHPPDTEDLTQFDEHSDERSDRQSSDGLPDEVSQEDSSDLHDPDRADDSATQVASCPSIDDVRAVEIRTEGRYRFIDRLAHSGLEDRGVRIYLPEAYSEANGPYPVLYMHDGQNLFDASTSAFGEWQVDEVLDDLTRRELVPPTIVVGVDNTFARIDDYTPTFDARYGGGKADLYVAFLADTLKPIIDANFFTRCDRSNTFVAGSSLGGLVSFHAFLGRPDVFGGIGVISPSFWWDDGEILDRFALYDGVLPSRLWFDAGTLEGVSPGSDEVPGMVLQIREARDEALDRGMQIGNDLGYLEDPWAAHNEPSWAARLDSILLFLLGHDRPIDLSLTDLDAFAYDTTLVMGADSARTTLAIESEWGGAARLTLPNTMVEFDSSNSGVAVVDERGTVTAASSGSATISAEFGGLQDDVTVAVVDSDTAAVTFSVRVPGSTPDSGSVFVAGSIAELGDWRPNGLELESLGDDVWELTIAMRVGTLFEFKVTRGTWDTVEKAGDGSEVANRRWLVEGVELIEVEVANWADQL